MTATVILKTDNEYLKELIPTIKRFPGDIGVNLPFKEDVLIPAKNMVKYDTEIKAVTMINDQRVGFLITPRSSVANIRTRSSIELANSPGLVDAEYTGNIFLIIKNDGDKDFTCPKGSAAFQIVPLGVGTTEVTMANSENVSLFENTERGGGGQGSTGNTIHE